MPNPCSTLGCYILVLNPPTVSEETASVVRPFQATIVLGKNEFLKPSVYATGRGTERDGTWFSCSLTELR